jgi:hypothetical protein
VRDATGEVGWEPTLARNAQAKAKRHAPNATARGHSATSWDVRRLAPNYPVACASRLESESSSLRRFGAREALGRSCRCEHIVWSCAP